MRRRLLISVSVMSVALLALAALTTSSEPSVVQGLAGISSDEVSVLKRGSDFLLFTQWEVKVRDLDTMTDTLRKNLPEREGWNGFSRGDERVSIYNELSSGSFFIGYERPANRAELLGTLIRHRGNVSRVTTGTGWTTPPSWFEILSN